MIQNTDNLLLAAKTEDEISHLEIYVYDESEEGEGNLYVHHDIMLPAFPLCLEWLDFRVGRKSAMNGPGNYVAVGTFDPEIEIWDLDTIDNMYPDVVLGAQDKTKKKKGGKKSKVGTRAYCSTYLNNPYENMFSDPEAYLIFEILIPSRNLTANTTQMPSWPWHGTSSIATFWPPPLQIPPSSSGI